MTVFYWHSGPCKSLASCLFHLTPILPVEELAVHWSWFGHSGDEINLCLRCPVLYVQDLKWLFYEIDKTDFIILYRKMWVHVLANYMIILWPLMHPKPKL